MRSVIVAATLALASHSALGVAQQETPLIKVTVAYTTSDTLIGALLDDPAARAIIDKHIPGFSSGERIDMARGMTLRAIQQFAPEKITDQVLADIDADFAKLAAKQ